jgi:hypothetical protein
VINIEVLSDTVNNVVVHVEGRRFPGLVVQGDRLHEWLRLAQTGELDSMEVLAYEIQLAAAELDRVTAEKRADG